VPILRKSISAKKVFRHIFILSTVISSKNNRLVFHSKKAQ
jgi:hypothetical protein